MARSSAQVQLKGLIEKAQLTPEEKADFSEHLKKLDLSPIEELLLTSLHTPSEATLPESFEIYDGWARLLADAKFDDQIWLREEDVPKNLTKELMETEEFIAKVLASLHRWYQGNYYLTAVAFARSLGDYSEGNFLFVDLAEEWQLFYNKVTALLFVEYFEFLPQVFQTVFLNQHLVIIAAQLGLDVKMAVAQDVDQLFDIQNRQEANTKHAAFLATNTTVLGAPLTASEPATVEYWIKQFNDKYSQGDPVQNVTKFLQENLFSNCTDEEVMVIRRLLELYATLLSGDFVLTPQDIARAKELQARERGRGQAARRPPDKPQRQPQPTSKPAAPDLKKIRPAYTDIKRVMEQRFPRDNAGQFTTPDEVLGMLSSLASKYQDEKINELYYYNLESGKFEWNNALLTT